MTEFDSRPETWEHIHHVRLRLHGVIMVLLDRAAGHDLSKLRDPELSMFNEYTPRLRELEYGSDEYKRCLEDMGAALREHYANNSHHPEFYADGIRGMTLIDLTEMLCDWAAAVMRVADGDLAASIEKNQERFGYSDELRLILENTARDLGMLQPRSTL